MKLTTRDDQLATGGEADAPGVRQQAAAAKMPAEHQHHQRVHHRDLGLFADYNNNSIFGGQHQDRRRDDKISYSAIVNKSIINKLAWGKSSQSLLLQTAATKQHQQQQHNNNNQNSTMTMREQADKHSQAMYRMTSMQLQSNRRYASPQQQQQQQQQQHQQQRDNNYYPIRQRRSSSSSSSPNTKSYNIMTPSLIALVITSCLITGLAANNEQQHASQVANNSPNSSPSPNPNPKLVDQELRRDSGDSPAASAASAAATADKSAEKNSIVASLSSAVASAAAAAAVAAAKSSLSTGDARSLLSSSSQSHSGSSGAGGHAHQQRSPGLSFALKLADSIPEVPYSILHNMKKLDHAAPFYNVPGKHISSISGKNLASKESGGAHGFLLSALTSPGGAADQLSALFRSPLWKRLADGYGEFTSEFRSLFRARPTSMKGPMMSSSTSKLLRDISMPAALMLLASAGLPNDWRSSMKNRRKSSSSPPLEPILSDSLSKLAALDPLDTSVASPSVQTNYSPVPQQQFFNQQPSFYAPNQLLNEAAARPPPSAFMNQRQYEQQQQQQVVGDTNMQQQIPSEVGAAANNWMSSNIGKSASNNMYAAAAAPPIGQQQNPVRRVGESVLYQPTAASELNGSKNQQQQQPLKPVNIDHNNNNNNGNYQQQAAAPEARELSLDGILAGGGGGSLFGSLTSNLAQKVQNPAKLLMNKLMNANGNSGASLLADYQMVNLPPSGSRTAAAATINEHHDEPGIFSSLISPFQRRRGDQLLSDKHRYSLVGGDTAEQQETTAAKSRLSSVLTKARRYLSSSASVAAESGSSPSLVPDRTINSQSELLRRGDAGNQPEQRDLTQLLPQSWREVYKKTLNSVKQEASTQWRSIEGQLSNWVQDKLKTLPMTASQPAPAATSVVGSSAAPASAGQSQPPAVVSNLIASVSSTAMNILGLGGRTSAPVANKVSGSEASPTEPTPAAAGGSAPKSTSSSEGPKTKQSPLAGVANLIVNTLTAANRQPTAAAASQKPDESSSLASASPTISQYPTLTGAQPPSSSATSGTTPTR